MSRKTNILLNFSKKNPPVSQFPEQLLHFFQKKLKCPSTSATFPKPAFPTPILTAIFNGMKVMTKQGILSSQEISFGFSMSKTPKDSSKRSSDSEQILERSV
jgi:hypothetical protein